VLLFFFLMVLGIAGIPGFDAFTGLFQRISIGIGFAWVAVLSIFLLRESYISCPPKKRSYSAPARP
jgi:hypothetical protein